MTRVLPLVIAALLLAGCERVDEATPTPSPTARITQTDVEATLLEVSDVGDEGEGWEAQPEAQPNTVQIGGRVGAANVDHATGRATAAFEQTEGSGFVSNSIFSFENAETAQAVILAHNQAETDTWTQEREEEGGATFTSQGPLDDVPSLGDEMFTARLDVVIRDADGNETERMIEYVTFRVGRLVSFVVTQDTQAGVLARRHERKVARIVT